MYEKLLSRFKRACNKNNQLGKKRNDTINKTRKKIPRQQIVCYIYKKELVLMMAIENQVEESLQVKSRRSLSLYWKI